MKPDTKSMNEPRGYSGSGRRSYANSGNSIAKKRQQDEGRISPWLPVALGVFALVVVGTALAETDRRRYRYAHSRWAGRMSDRLTDRWNDWWPEIRDTAEDTGSRARSWLYDAAPSRSALSDLFSTDWLPDSRVAKRRLLANFDWNHPPRWLRDVDLSSSGKRRRFIRDLKRYGNRKSDDVMSSLGLR